MDCVVDQDANTYIVSYLITNIPLSRLPRIYSSQTAYSSPRLSFGYFVSTSNGAEARVTITAGLLELSRWQLQG
jgi:hypothetical protein